MKDRKQIVVRKRADFAINQNFGDWITTQVGDDTVFQIDRYEGIIQIHKLDKRGIFR